MAELHTVWGDDIMCCHPAQRLEILDMSYRADITEEGSSNGYSRDLFRGHTVSVVSVRCSICNTKFELTKRTPFEKGDWSKLSPGTYAMVGNK